MQHLSVRNGWVNFINLILAIDFYSFVNRWISLSNRVVLKNSKDRLRTFFPRDLLSLFSRLLIIFLLEYYRLLRSSCSINLSILSVSYTCFPVWTSIWRLYVCFYYVFSFYTAASKEVFFPLGSMTLSCLRAGSDYTTKIFYFGLCQ